MALLLAHAQTAPKTATDHKILDQSFEHAIVKRSIAKGGRTIDGGLMPFQREGLMLFPDLTFPPPGRFFYDLPGAQTEEANESEQMSKQVAAVPPGGIWVLFRPTFQVKSSE